MNQWNKCFWNGSPAVKEKLLLYVKSSKNIILFWHLEISITDHFLTSSWKLTRIKFTFACLTLTKLREGLKKNLDFPDLVGVGQKKSNSKSTRTTNIALNEVKMACQSLLDILNGKNTPFQKVLKMDKMNVLFI